MTEYDSSNVTHNSEIDAECVSEGAEHHSPRRATLVKILPLSGLALCVFGGLFWLSSWLLHAWHLHQMMNLASNPDPVMLGSDSDHGTAVDMGSIYLGKSETVMVSVTIAHAGTLGKIRVVTRGAEDLDFSNSGGGSCTAGVLYIANSSCTVAVRFSPRFIGMRYGGVMLYEESSRLRGEPKLPLATGYIKGTGTGQDTLHIDRSFAEIGNGWVHPWAMTIDGGGNLYVANYPTEAYASGGSVFKETKTESGYLQSRIPGGFVGPTGIAVDGAGNLYIADSSLQVIFKEVPVGDTYLPTQIPTPGIGWPLSLAVDGSGNVYVSDPPNKRVLKETLFGGNYIQSSIGIGLNSVVSIAVDGRDNLYIYDLVNRQIVQEAPDGGRYIQSVITAASQQATDRGQCLAVDSLGNLYLTDTSEGHIVMVPWNGTTFDKPRIIRDVPAPWGIALDSTGNLFYSSDANVPGKVWRLDMQGVQK